MSESLGTIWVCVDCMVAREIDPHSEVTAISEREPWNLIKPGYSVTLGMTYEAHECGLTDETWPGWDECDCERKPFSWSSCDGCGSTLGGERHAYTLWCDSREHNHEQRSN